MTSIVNMVTFAWIETSQVFGWNWHLAKVESMNSNSMVLTSEYDAFFIRRMGCLVRRVCFACH